MPFKIGDQAYEITREIFEVWNTRLKGSDLGSGILQMRYKTWEVGLERKNFIYVK